LDCLKFDVFFTILIHVFNTESYLMPTLTRKEFIKKASLGLLLVSNPGLIKRVKWEKDAETIFTVNGQLKAKEMGSTLVHEHLLSSFGLDAMEPGQYDEEKALTEVVPYLKYLQSLGCNTIVDCTAAYFGRNVRLLRKLSQKSGIQILTNTGIYGAASDRYVPQSVRDQSPDQLAAQWIDEFNNGIQGTDIKPGFLKCGVDSGPLSEIDGKLVRAAAITHLETGLLLQIHTSNNPEAVFQQLNILEEEGVSPTAWVWVHANKVTNSKPLIEAARRGAWISLDNLKTVNYFNGKESGSNTLSMHYDHLEVFRESGLLDRVLLSHDGSLFPPEGKDKRPMDILYNSFIPMMEAGGFSQQEIDKIIIHNPAEAFTLSIRRR